MFKRGVFLDRDGVINKSKVINGKPYSPESTSEVVLIDGVPEAIKLLQRLEFVIVIVTNQPDISRKKMSVEISNSINDYIANKTGIEHFYVCPHDDRDKCLCRKPQPGLIHEAASKLHINVNKSFLIGDRWRDIQAGQEAGCECFFIDYNYNEIHPKQPFVKVSSLFEASRIISDGIRKNGHQ